MIYKFQKTTPAIGYVTLERKCFKDREYFSPDSYIYLILKKIKIWYGFSKYSEINKNNKIILGIQCTYLNIKTNEIKTLEPHCGDISGDDIEIEEIEIKNGDHFKKVYINFDKNINYLKFVTKNQKCIKFGEEQEYSHHSYYDFNNDNKIQIIQTFFGYYNDYGLTALGFNYISKEDLFIISFEGIFRLKHILKNKEKEKNWNNPEISKKLSIEMQAILKLCFQRDDIFLRIIKYNLPF